MTCIKDFFVFEKPNDVQSSCRVNQFDWEVTLKGIKILFGGHLVMLFHVFFFIMKCIRCTVVSFVCFFFALLCPTKRFPIPKEKKIRTE